LENLHHEKVNTIETLQKLTADGKVYKDNLRYDKEGIKQNLIQLKGINTADLETIGKHLILLYQEWKPTDEPKIGKLYGFNLYIRQQREAVEEKNGFGYRYYNTLSAERSESAIKYTYNNGHPNTDNPKLAARYFLNAIDRIETLKEKYQIYLSELEKNIPIVTSISKKPFEKESELVSMKSELSKLEREIAVKIQENQMKQNGLLDTDKVQQENNLQKETPVIQMTPKESTPLQVVIAKVNGAIVDGKEHFGPNGLQQPRIKRSNRLRL
jgi:hypothetical protein